MIRVEPGAAAPRDDAVGFRNLARFTGDVVDGGEANQVHAAAAKRGRAIPAGCGAIAILKHDFEAAPRLARNIGGIEIGSEDSAGRSDHIVDHDTIAGGGAGSDHPCLAAFLPGRRIRKPSDDGLPFAKDLHDESFAVSIGVKPGSAG